MGDDGTSFYRVERTTTPEVEGEQETETESETREISQTVACIFYGQKLGAAVYDAESFTLYLLADSIDISPAFITLRKFISQTQPRCICAPFHLDVRALEILKEANDSQLHLLSSSQFRYEVCKSKLFTLTPCGSPSLEVDEEGHMMYMTSLIDMSNECMVRAAGALVGFIEKNRLFVDEHDGFKLSIINIKPVHLEDVVFMETESYMGLQIFRQDIHPSGYKGGDLGGHKEGLSLFAMMDCCRSSLGSKMLRALFQRPTNKLEILMSRLDAIEFLVNTPNRNLVESLHDCCGKIKNITHIVRKLNGHQCLPSEWKTLSSTLQHLLLLGEISKSFPQNVECFKELSSGITDGLYHCSNLLEKVFDVEESELNSRFCVKLGVDEYLDGLRRTYHGLADLMLEFAEEELKHLPSSLTSCNVVYLPNLGYLLTIPKWRSDLKEEECAIPGQDYVFSTYTNVYYKNARLAELDESVGDIHIDIMNFESKLEVRLGQEMLKNAVDLVHAVQLAAYTDCLIAMAKSARNYNYIRPDLVEDSVIEIEDGRHPVLEVSSSICVPNSTYSGGERNMIHIITAPNASGKSVYLKQTGVIVYMAHIGSFVPAGRAKIGLVDGIYTRICCVDSISYPLSTFTQDLKLMERAADCSSRSLVICDEFGKGTSDACGLALLAAYMKHFIPISPHLFVATHFHKVRSLLSSSSSITYQTTKFVLESDGGIAFLYEIVDGLCDESYARHVALRAELPQMICSRAAQIELYEQTGQLLSPKSNEDINSVGEVVANLLACNLDDHQLFEQMKNKLISN